MLDRGPQDGNNTPSLVQFLDFLRRRATGQYEVDDFGYDRDLTEQVLAPALRPLLRHWFGLTVGGIEHLPDSGGALVVANHSGAIAIDAVVTALAVHDHHPARRPLRLLAADLVFGWPFVGEFARKSGATLACAPDALRLLERGELVGVWPEGYKGVGKPYAKRYELQRFGRGGFVQTALQAQVPIIPCAITGAADAYPMLGDFKPLARLLGLPYFPITPTFPWLGPVGLLPLPSKWHIEFGAPIDTTGLPATAATDPMAVFNLADQVRDQIQQQLDRLRPA